MDGEAIKMCVRVRRQTRRDGRKEKDDGSDALGWCQGLLTSAPAASRAGWHGLAQPVEALESAIELLSSRLTTHNDQPYLPCPKDALVYAIHARLRPYAVTLTPSPTAVNWNDAQKRVLKSYREWIRAV